jgi:hypothetical protein
MWKKIGKTKKKEKGEKYKMQKGQGVNLVYHG